MILTPTKERGAQIKESPLEYAETSALVTDEQLSGALSVDGVNAPFLAELLSAFVTHERCGRHLYRSVAGRSNNPVLRQRYEHFGGETEHHVEVLEGLIRLIGGNPAFVSPMARAVEAQDTKLLESTFLVSGALDIMTEEMAMLDAVFVAESVDRANWHAMREICEDLPAGEVQRRFTSAVDEVLSQEEEHLDWARETRAKLTKLQLKSSLMATMGAKSEELIATVRGWFS